MHGGGPPVTAGKPLAPEYRAENVELVAAGCANLARHIENSAAFGVPVVVAINKFTTDTDAELEAVRAAAMAAGAAAAVVCDHHARGGAGAAGLARAVVDACAQPSSFKFTYDLNTSIKEKLDAIARGIYRAASVELSPEAAAAAARFESMGIGHLPVCMAKTQYSFSADPAAKGAPSGFVLPVRELRPSAGAGFIVALVGEMATMPGLPTRPCFYDIDVDGETGRIVGLS